jgi:cation diffusion facilitator family transporter
MTESSNHMNEHQEKRSAAGSSLLAALGITLFKIVVGVMTNSLGILAEAAHSGLDLVAALVTFLAIQIADKPADHSHHFGHGKVENLSALFETLLLLATSGWIIYEAIERLFFRDAVVVSSIWSFIVIGTSIVVDYSRSRVLFRAARKYNSQALEADALHFSTDIWSSAVVFLGLIGIAIADFVPTWSWIQKADSIAASIVAFIVIFVSAKLGWRTIQALLDAAPAGLDATVKKVVASIPGVVDAHAIRVRPSGSGWFIDLHLTMNGHCSLNTAHTAAENAERAIQASIPKADITVHVEPAEE